MSNYQVLFRKDFASKLAQLKKSTHYVNPSDKQYYDYTQLIAVGGGYGGTWFLVHSMNDDLNETLNCIADYCRDKGYIGYFAEESRIEELRNDAIEAGHEEDEYINDFYTMTDSGDYFDNMQFIYQLGGMK